MVLALCSKGQGKLLYRHRLLRRNLTLQFTSTSKQSLPVSQYSPPTEEPLLGPTRSHRSGDIVFCVIYVVEL